MLRTLRRMALARVLGARSPRNWIGLAGAIWAVETVVKLAAKHERIADTIRLSPGALFQVETTKPLSRRKRRKARKVSAVDAAERRT